jgi:hypothetical protein
MQVHDEAFEDVFEAWVGVVAVDGDDVFGDVVDR